ncbi:MAG: heparinase II/III family protein [Polymorphobacter sp.]
MARKAGTRTPRADPPDAIEPDVIAPVESEGRLLRVASARERTLGEWLATRVSVSLYNTPLHRLRLRGRFPLKLLGVPEDPVPGSVAIGERIVAGRLIHAGHTAMTRDLSFAEPEHPAAWRDWANGWQWLRDIAAHTPDRKAAAALAEPLVTRWLASFAEFEPTAWRADVTGTRLLLALGHAPLVLSSSDQIYRSALLSGIATWARHLDRAAFRMADGPGKAKALAGLYAAGVLIPGGEARAQVALAALDKLLGTLVLPDGGIATRAPVDALQLAELLLFAANCSPAMDVRPPPLFAETLARLVPSLKGLALGDGVIGAWHGAAAIAPEPLHRLTKRVATGNALARGGRWSGYHRLSAGKTVLVIDAGPPPLARTVAGGHAGTLAFELSDGADRLITNCGGARGLAAPLAEPLAAGLRTSAAHSTLVIAETNSTRLRDNGSLGLGVEEVTIQARSSEQGHWLETTHDGYGKRFGMVVRRRLFLSPDGQDLRGEDMIEPAKKSLLKRRPDRNFDIRFHLGPGVAATPTADSAGALLKLPQGRVWALKVRGGKVDIEPSLWVDPAGTIHKTQQLVIRGRTAQAAASIGWSFKRAGK